MTKSSLLLAASRQVVSWVFAVLRQVSKLEGLTHPMGEIVVAFWDITGVDKVHSVAVERRIDSASMMISAIYAFQKEIGKSKRLNASVRFHSEPTGYISPSEPDVPPGTANSKIFTSILGRSKHRTGRACSQRDWVNFPLRLLRGLIFVHLKTKGKHSPQFQGNCVWIWREGNKQGSKRVWRCSWSGLVTKPPSPQSASWSEKAAS